MKSTVIGISGPIAVGKTTVTNYLKEHYGGVSFRFSSMLRDMLDRIYLEQTRENMQVLSAFLRSTFGQDMMSNVMIKDIENATDPLIVVEGVRRPSDVTHLRNLPNFHLVGMNAEQQIRFERLAKRHENPDDFGKTFEEFQKDENREAEQEIQNIVAQSDFQIDNSGSLEDLTKQVEEVAASLALKK